MYFLYDGSLNGDWVSRYVLHLATEKDKTVRLVHILDNKTQTPVLNEKINAMEELFTSHGIRFESRIFPMKRNVLDSLLDHISEKTDELVICGTRIREKKYGFFKNTISEYIMKTGKFNVIAFRVVNPGMMGNPDTLLFPVLSDPRTLTHALYFLPYFNYGIQKLQILKLIEMNSLRYSWLDTRNEAIIKKNELIRLQTSIEELIQNSGLDKKIFNIHSVITNDSPREVAIYASNKKSRLILTEFQNNRIFQPFFRNSFSEVLLRKSSVDTAIFQRKA